MLKGRDILMYFAVKNHGDWNKIYEDIKNKSDFNDEDVKKVKANLNSDYVTLLDDEYPNVLKNIYKPPFVLFYHGDVSLLKSYRKNLAVVGSRDPNDYSLTNTKIFISEMDGAFNIVSGLALGIDAAAHKAAIDNNAKTIAVLASGINHPYPKTNKWLYDKIKADHLIISEYPGDLAPNKENFPFRNRLITGISWGVFVPEVKRASGTMISIGHACSQNRDVFVLPQPVKNGTYNNHLISEGACIVESGEDIIHEKI